MARIRYQNKRFRETALALIAASNRIIDEYSVQGFTLTLRQLYYQLVSRATIPNNQQEYNRLGEVISDARLAGLVDWEAIEDRTRYVRALSHWESPQEIVAATARAFRLDMWATQEYRPEVWIEKDALVGVIEGVCNEFDVPYFSCRGYTSQSEMWRASVRLSAHLDKGLLPIIFHFGDHDPSGKDMTRDIGDRLEVFGVPIKIDRLALNMDQVDRYKPPPNPAKITDSRATAYIAEFGPESWELDALEPATISALIRNSLLTLIDDKKWQAQTRKIKEHRFRLKQVAENWPAVVAAVKKSKENA